MFYPRELVVNGINKERVVPKREVNPPGLNCSPFGPLGWSSLYRDYSALKRRKHGPP